ncbi:hypothetical protein K466DRAFT_667465 [Polyporus arcularius HHB13444]|uniref:F-box domain-containing protein n=1 Tax=Polyporus arcularius HHB13444 TaxID=1314778 RepID=A0A5C3P4Y1_9APHY|nr:hypothetical protein K466DRAFT_667465 [Polyporus arcularius HHB13444]
MMGRRHVTILSAATQKFPKRLNLPSELWDLIIDHLCANIRSLKMCSLVCKAWSRRTEPYLFNTLSYSYSNYNAPDPEDLAAFLSASPRIAQHVHTLRYSRWINFPWSTLVRILLFLRNIRNLELDRVRIVDEPDVHEHHLCSPHPPLGHLDTFSLLCCKPTDSIAIFRLLDMFTSIARLTLHGSTVSMNRTAMLIELSEVYPTRLAVDTLSTENLPWQFLSSMVHRQSTMARSVTSLRLRLPSNVYGYYPPPAIGTVLDILQSLRHFQFGPLTDTGIQTMIAQGHALGQMNLHRCKRLQIVEFTLPTLLRATGLRELIHVLITTLSLPASVRELRFSFVGHVPRCCAPPEGQALLEHFLWAELDDRMMAMPSRVHFRFAFVEVRDNQKRYREQEYVDSFRAFCTTTLPGVTESQRLSVLTEVPVSANAVPGCPCPQCCRGSKLEECD